MDEWDFLDEDFCNEFFEDTFTVVVIYDIIDNKRRAFLKNLLNSYGNRIQRSAFECLLTREKCETLLKEIEKFAEEGDLIRIYRLNQNVKKVIYGELNEIENEDYYFFQQSPRYFKNGGQSIFFIVKKEKYKDFQNSHENDKMIYDKIRDLLREIRRNDTLKGDGNHNLNNLIFF